MRGSGGPGMQEGILLYRATSPAMVDTIPATRPTAPPLTLTIVLLTCTGVIIVLILYFI